jgi:hypothetical protein
MEPARHLAAHAQGQFICEAWTGTVLTVHARAVNILRADGLVVSLVADMDSMTGLGVCVPGLFEEPPEAAAVGREVVRDGQWIEVAEFARLDLSKSRMWKSTIDDALIREVPAARIAQVRDALLLYGKTGGLLGILSPERATNPFVEKARKALVDRRLEALVGLGPGLTPAGDDFLVGALMAFPCKPRGELLRAAWPWTTPAGRTLLWMALRRSFPAYLVALADCIVCSNSPEAISEAVRVACAHGETSGSDALAGFCWARLNLNRTRLRPDAVRCRLKAWQ